MQTFGVREISSIAPDAVLCPVQDVATRKLLHMEELDFTSEGAYLLPDRKRNEIIAKAQRSLDSISGSNRLTLLIESFLQYEQHYFRYKKMTSEENANSPEVICAEMQALQEKRAIIMADVEEFKDTLGHWPPSEEANSALKRMPLIDAPLAAYLSKYFDELSSGALKKSPYKERSRTLPMPRLLSDCQKDIASGKMQIYEISGNALANLEKNMNWLSKCTISSEEFKQCEALQKGILGNSAQLLLNEACCQTILTLATINDVSEQVSHLKKDQTHAQLAVMT